MRYSNISITLPPGYRESIEEESNRYGLNRSEFVRVLFDGFLRSVVDKERSGTSDVQALFPHVLPHRRAEAEAWLHDYVRLINRIVDKSAQHKAEHGNLDRGSVFDCLPKDDPGLRPGRASKRPA